MHVPGIQRGCHPHEHQMQATRLQQNCITGTHHQTTGNRTHLHHTVIIDHAVDFYLFGKIGTDSDQPVIRVRAVGNRKVPAGGGHAGHGGPNFQCTCLYMAGAGSTGDASWQADHGRKDHHILRYRSEHFLHPVLMGTIQTSRRQISRTD